MNGFFDRETKKRVDDAVQVLANVFVNARTNVDSKQDLLVREQYERTFETVQDMIVHLVKIEERIDQLDQLWGK